MKRLIAIDSDGTLRKSDGSISNKTKRAIKKQIDNGNVVVICTARPRYHTLKISNDVGASNFLISSNGSEIFNAENNKVIWAKYLKKTECKILYEYAKANDIRIMFVLENTEYVTKFTRNDNQILLDDTNLCRVLNGKVKQAMIIGENKIKIENFKLYVESKKMRILDSSQKKSESWFSVVNNKSSKGAALEILSNYLGIPLSNTIAIGNDNNDISMFETAGISVAVMNSTCEAKKKAMIITESNDDDGVAKFLNKL